MRITKRLAAALIGLTLLVSARSNIGEHPVVWIADDLIGMKVISQQGDDLGEIHDIVVHPGGVPSHAVLSFGGWLGLGDRLFAMPWSVLRSAPETDEGDSERSLVLQLDKEKLETAPGFDKKDWPSMASPDWAKEIERFYATNPKPEPKPVAPTATPVITWRVSELNGADVENPKGTRLGQIDELAIDTTGRVSYVAVKIGGPLLGGGKFVAVPWDALTFSLGEMGSSKVITLTSTEKELARAPAFLEGQEHRAEMCDLDWITRVYSYFSVSPYWNSTTGPVGARN